MGGSDFTTQGLVLGPMKPADRQRIERAAAVRIADEIAAPHPHPDGRRVAHDPTARADVLELLDVIGFLPNLQGERVSTTTELKPAEIADAVDKAAEVIEKNGLHKGYLYDEAKADEGTKPAECPVDAVGAINTAVFGQPCWPAEQHPGSLLAQAATLALQETVDKPVPGWNDEPRRQKRQVVKALRDTAARLREAA